MEELLNGFKLWGPFAVFFVAMVVFGWRILNRREDKLEARHKELLSQVREDSQRRDDKLETLIKGSNDQFREEMRGRDDQLETRMNEGFKILRNSIDQLREEMRERYDQLEARMNEGFKILKNSIDQLREDIRQTNTRLDATAQTLGAEISKLTERIEVNSHDLRMEIARLNQNHVNHLEHHEDFHQRSEQKPE